MVHDELQLCSYKYFINELQRGVCHTNVQFMKYIVHEHMV